MAMRVIRVAGGGGFEIAGGPAVKRTAVCNHVSAWEPDPRARADAAGPTVRSGGVRRELRESGTYTLVRCSYGNPHHVARAATPGQPLPPASSSSIGM